MLRELTPCAAPCVSFILQKYIYIHFFIRLVFLFPPQKPKGLITRQAIVLSFCDVHAQVMFI